MPALIFGTSNGGGGTLKGFGMAFSTFKFGINSYRDWYNLEKSKRVKEFRCGEFDACIERAEASQNITIKKREKYARREDAILHALELEKQLKLETTSSRISSKINGAPKEDSIIFSSPETYIEHELVARGKLASHKCKKFLEKEAFSVEDIDDSLYLHEGRANQKFSLEHGNTEYIPQIRGLQDFGLRMAESKRKPSLSTSWENSNKSFNNHVQSLSKSDYIIERADQATTSRNAVLVKRKRSYGGAIDEFLVKKRDRRRPLVQVLQSSAKLPSSYSFQPSCSVTDTLNTEEAEKVGSTWRAKRSRCVYLPADLEDQSDHGGYTHEHMPASTNQFEICNDIIYSGNVCDGYLSSGLIKMNDSDYCEGDLLEPNMLEEADTLTDTTDILLPGSKDCDPPELHVSGEFRSLIREDVPLSAFTFQLNGQAKDVSFDAGVSKWCMKGKRSIRNVGKRLVDTVDVRTCCPDLERSNSSFNSTHDIKESNSKFERAETSSERIPKTGFHPINEVFDYTHDESDLIDKGLDQSQLTVCTRNHCSLHDSDEDSHGLAFNSQLGEPVNELDPQLVDVDLKVQSSYQGGHVPLVSLMSRLNGKAIIGHPVQIEILEDGSANHLIVSAHNVVIDEGTAPQAMWLTARRTAMHRVPRSTPSTTASEGAVDANLFQHALHKKSCYHYLNHKVRPGKKFQKKNTKRLCLFSRKTRKLSSLASNKKLGDESVDHKLMRSNAILGGSVPLVTCVPVKVVFSRILEAVNRPSAFACHLSTSSPET